MSHDTPARFRSHYCSRCQLNTELFYCRSTDEYLCEECIMDLADAAREHNEEDTIVAISRHS